MNYPVAIKNVSKSYRKVKALSNISFEVNKGELFGIIGPDGAGKSTLFRILVTLLKPDEGEAFVEGYNVVNQFKEIRKIVGYMPGRFSLYQDLSVEENMNFFASIFKTTVKENYHLVKDIYSQIEPFKTRLAGKLSGGMKQKLALSCALIHSPTVLFLDEPTTGVDAVSRKEFWEMLQRLKQQGITILVSTPYMDEAGLCDRVALIQNGEIMEIDSPEGIIGNYTKNLYKVKTDKMFEIINDLRDYQYTDTAYRFGDSIHFTSKQENPDSDELLSYLQGKGHDNVQINEIKPDVEDCFMALM